MKHTKKLTTLRNKTTTIFLSPSPSSSFSFSSDALTPAAITDIVSKMNSKVNQVQTVIDFSIDAINNQTTFVTNQIEAATASTSDPETIKLLESLRTTVTSLGGESTGSQRRKRAAVIIDCINVLAKISETSGKISDFEAAKNNASDQIAELDLRIASIDATLDTKSPSERENLLTIRASLVSLKSLSQNVLASTTQQIGLLSKGVQNLYKFAYSCGFTTTTTKSTTSTTSKTSTSTSKAITSELFNFINSLKWT